jgi:hypothetical protein
MKTGVTLKSTDRKLFGITIRQDTKDRFLYLTDLEDAYLREAKTHRWQIRTIQHILSTRISHERIYYLLQIKNLLSPTVTLEEFVADMEKGPVSHLKKLKVYKTRGSGTRSGPKIISCLPAIWGMIALELNPMVYAVVSVWLEDTLIIDRIDAGSHVLPMNSAIARVIHSPNYPLFATEINLRALGDHYTGIRNNVSARELRKVTEIEKMVIFAIGNGWVTDEKGILKLIRTY